MKLYNTYTQKKEDFHPIEEGKVSIYVCGPTVYNDPHIGNARPMVVFDTLVKAMKASGLDVTFASNYTDVDDKIINEAMKRGISEKELTDHYISNYEKIRRDLHTDLPDYTPRVSETMDEIIHFIDELVKNGSAYVVDGDVFYSVGDNKKYGELSHQNPDDLKVGARIESNEQKRNPLDFVLWKATDQGIQWDSPWSRGRPGWHTECVVMIQDVFNRNLIDIHGGGADLKFPHHENEVAQSRSLNDTSLANYWVHNGMINIDQKKMSKSLGNVWLIKDMLEKYSGNELRWLLLSTHYRAPLNISVEALETARKDVKKIENTRRKASVTLQLKGAEKTGELDQDLWSEFLETLNDDLNTPNAFSSLQKTVKEINVALRQREPDLKRLAVLLNTLNAELYVLGIEFEEVVVSEEDLALYNEWKAAVAAKDFEAADPLRKTLMEKGIL